MNREEHLLTCLAEECAEVAQRVSKALMRFGLDEVQPGQPEGHSFANSTRIALELKDLLSVAAILERDGSIPLYLPSQAEITAKADKIERFMAISREQGVLP